MDGPVERASFVALTRVIEGGEPQLLVEINSPKHKGLFHAIGGKSDRGESAHETANRELGEECQLLSAEDPSLYSKWLPLGASDLLGCVEHPASLYGTPFENHYYLYPGEVKAVTHRDVDVQWMRPGELTEMNSTHALLDLVQLLETVGGISLS